MVGTVSKPCQQYFTCTSHDLWSDSLHIWSDDTWKYFLICSIFKKIFWSNQRVCKYHERAAVSTWPPQSACLDCLMRQEEPVDSTDAKVLTDIYGDVELSHVSFGYTKDHTIIHDLSLHAEPGKLIAIVGPTGAGKTTIINLLMRFYDIDSGKITIDGNDITKVTRDSLRRAFAMVLQDTWLFHGTIYENIAYGKPVPHSKMCSVSARPPVFITI